MKYIICFLLIFSTMVGEIVFVEEFDKEIDKSHFLEGIDTFKDEIKNGKLYLNNSEDKTKLTLFNIPFVYGNLYKISLDMKGKVEGKSEYGINLEVGEGSFFYVGFNRDGRGRVVFFLNSEKFQVLFEDHINNYNIGEVNTLSVELLLDKLILSINGQEFYQVKIKTSFFRKLYIYQYGVGSVEVDRVEVEEMADNYNYIYRDKGEVVYQNNFDKIEDKRLNIKRSKKLESSVSKGKINIRNVQRKDYENVPIKYGLYRWSAYIFSVDIVQMESKEYSKVSFVLISGNKNIIYYNFTNNKYIKIVLFNGESKESTILYHGRPFNFNVNGENKISFVSDNNNEEIMFLLNDKGFFIKNLKNFLLEDVRLGFYQTENLKLDNLEIKEYVH